MNRYFGVHVLDGEWHALLPRYLILDECVDGRRVLDVGCGSGIGSSMLLEMGADRVVGIDTRLDLLDLAEIKHAKQDLDFHSMEAADLGFADDTFDLVVGLDPEHPVTDPAVLSEVRRVLAPEGSYVCAIERRTVAGFDAILPRHDGPTPDGPSSRKKRAPQVGELSNHFKHLTRLHQQPRLSWVFETPDDEGPSDDEEPSDDADNGDEPDPQSDQHPCVEDTLCAPDSDSAAVELLICGDSEFDSPAPRDVRLPYYRVVERLNAVLRDLQFGQPADNRDGAPSEAADRGPDRGPTGGPSDSPYRRRALRERLREVSAAYDQLRQTVDRVREQTRAVLDHQARRLDRLTDELQNPNATERTGRQNEETTGVYEMPSPPTDASSSDDGFDTGEYPAQTTGADELERLQRQRDELEAELEARTQHIERLRERLEAAEQPEAPPDEQGLEESTTPEDEQDGPPDAPVDELGDDTGPSPEETPASDHEDAPTDDDESTTADNQNADSDNGDAPDADDETDGSAPPKTTEDATESPPAGESAPTRRDETVEGSDTG